ncbi:MAG: di-trans,poly-cis-decaprenylcistransferase [Candidatus Omnitrophica bacterium CG1_02_49_10]|nr:MAG: di-trans,poly-cis-decaprenylcistransferase [Candidatus Omnitrophica bacterium CG1_02_49_10]
MKNIPEHIAIIMDGNGRWAHRRGLPRIMGHKRGVDTIQKVIGGCRELGVKMLTVYAFSTENWHRPKREVGQLMALLKAYLRKDAERLNKNNIRLYFSGRIKGLPDDVRASIKEALEITRNNDGFILNIALNYGGRAEIVDAARKVASDAMSGKLNLSSLDEKLFSRYLYTAGLPDPDLVIRTSGEMRISNFLIWQASYAEFYVTEKLWPSFTVSDLKMAVEEFGRRKRRFGR